MNCNEIRELISCMLDNELNSHDSAIVGEHLADCPECMRVFEAFHELTISLEELEDVPDGFTEDVMSCIHDAAEIPAPKKKRGRILRIASLAGMAACFAIVMMAGTRFASTHKYIGGSNSDTAEYVHIQKTPKPANLWYSFAATPAPADAGQDDSGIATPAVSDGDELLNAETTEAPGATPTAELLPPELSAPDASTNDEVLDPEASQSPRPAVTPTPVPPMDLMFPEDLLIMDTEAEYELFTEYPAYEVIVTDSNRNTVSLKLWMDGSRIYCKHEDTQTAWYTVGTAAQLTELLGEPAATPVPITPAPSTPTPTADAAATTVPASASPAPTSTITPAVPTPDAVQPAATQVPTTPEAVSPSPKLVFSTPKL